MPLGASTRLLAISSRSVSSLGFVASSWSLSRERVELSLEFSRLRRASFRLSSTDLPSRKLPRTVAAAME